MTYDFIAIPDDQVPHAAEPVFEHLLVTYASETNKTVSVWRAVPDDALDFKPHEKMNSIRTIMVHLWVVWRRVLHTCHHRTQVQSWLRLAGQHVPAIYGPSGDETWSGADPTYSVDAAN